MSDQTALKTKVEQIDAPSLATDLRAEKAQSLRNKVTGAGALRITGISNQKKEPRVETVENFTAEPFDADQEEVLLLTPANSFVRVAKPSLTIKAIYFIGTVLTVAWIFACLLYAALYFTIYSMSPNTLGGFIAGMFAPPAMFWLMASSLHRRADVHQYATALRSELQSLLFPSEETAGLINKDIQMLCEQAAEVSAASKGVLKSLQRARQGLRAEIRDFTGVSKKAEFHIDRLSEALLDKTAKLGILTEEIEARTSNIDARVRTGAEAWETATTVILTRASEMESALGRGSEKLLDAANEVGGSVDKVATRLESLNTKFETHKNGLSSVAKHVAEETERLGITISAKVETLNGVTDRTLSAMARSGETIQKHKEALDSSAASVAGHAERIAAAITSSVGKLEDTVKVVIGRTEGLQISIDEKTIALHDVIKNVSNEANLIEEAGKHAANKLSETLSVAVAGAETVGSAIRRSVEMLENASETTKNNAKELVDSTSRRVEELNVSSNDNAENIRGIISLLDINRANVEKAIDDVKKHIESLRTDVERQDQQLGISVSGYGEQIAKVRDSLSEPLKTLQAAIAEADARHEVIENVLGRRVAELSGASEKAAVSAETIRDILKGQVQEISALSGQVAGHARTITEQMETQKETLATEIVDTLKRVTEVSDALGKESAELHKVSAVAVTDIVELRDEIAGRCREVTDFTTKAFSELESVDRVLETKVGFLQERADVAATSLGSLKGALEGVAERIEPLTDRVIERAEEMYTRYEKLKSGFESSSDSNLTRLKQIGVLFDERLIALKEGSGEAATILRTSADTMRERVADIESASSSAGERLKTIASSLQGQSSDIHLITDHALLKVEAIQKAINEQFHEFSASVGHAVAQLKDASEQFVSNSQNIQTESEKTSSGITRVGTLAREQSRALKDAAQQAVTETEQLAASVQRESETLLKQASGAISELRKTGDTFSIRAREVAEQMKASLNISESYGKELKLQASTIAELSVKSSEQLEQSSSILNARISDVGRAASEAGIKIEGARERLSNEAERLLHVSSAALEAAKDASFTFGKQSESLFKASHDAAEFVEQMQARETRAQREMFLSSAKFIVESLHSLSVDMTRILDGEIPEKTWKAFQRGDVSAFTRRIVEMGNDWPLDRAREKYGRDTEFRTYVMRFIRQFEEMFEQAMDSDHGALLSSTIGSSDVARLYNMLCQVAGKLSKLTQEMARAA